MHTNIGIIDLEVYFPKLFVHQAELGLSILLNFHYFFQETFDHASKGKYTIGLG